MSKYILKRLALSVMTILLIMVVLFILMHLMPGSPFNDEKLNLEQRQVLYEKYGLDQPLAVQFVKYLGNMIRGDLGVSYSLAPNIPDTQLLGRRILVSVGIGAAAVLIGLALGLTIGILGAVYKGHFPDYFCTVVIVAGISIPSYLVAIFLSYYLGFQFRIFPIFYDVRSKGLSSVMPALAMSLGATAFLARFTRESVREALESEYVLFAKSKGVSKAQLIFRYALRNALIPIITILGPLIVGEMSGSVICESIFGVPGVGNLMMQAISANDYNLVFAIALFFSVLFIVVNFIIDLLYCLIDPRIRLS